MKKVLSLILAVCMIASFAMVASAANTHATGYTLDVVEGETTVTATLTLDGAFTDAYDIRAFIKYDATKVSFASTTICDDFQELMDAKTAWAVYTSTGDGKYMGTTVAGVYAFAYATTELTSGTDEISGEDVALATITFNKLADVAEGDITLLTGQRIGRGTITTAVKYEGESAYVDTLPSTNFTNYVAAPVYPTIELDAAAADVAEIDVENDAYTVTVTGAPVFGKAYVVYANGEAIVAGTKYTATEDTVITVALEDDTTKAIHTYAKAYAAAGEAAVFAKFTNGATDYGFEVAAFADDTFSPDMEVFIKDGVFAAANAVDGVFGVKFTGVEAGSYDAVPYADGVKGDAITFVVE